MVVRTAKVLMHASIVVHSMMRRGHENVLQHPKATNNAGMDPKLINQVQLTNTNVK